MNYRHAYHAGGFADVFKHAILALLIERLKAKESAFAVLDTHAGLGWYDLEAQAPRRTREFEQGVLRVLADPRPPPQLAPYLAALGARNPDLNPGGTNLRVYPGSPAIARALLRPQDRLILVEMHPEDGAELKRRFARDAQTSVHLGDGYNALKGLVPPSARRGLALVDPPFEATNEFERLAAAIKAAHRRWPTGIYALWYPIKEGAPAAKFLALMKRSGIRRQLLATLNVQAGGVGLLGCGMVVINPPWQVEDDLRTLAHWLARRMGRGRGAGGQVEWLAPE